MGGVSDKDLNTYIDEIWNAHVSTPTASRTVIPALIEDFIDKPNVPPAKQQYLALCDSELAGAEFTKPALVALCAKLRLLQQEDIELAAIKKQIEFYLSDSNLRHDKYFHSVVSHSPGGYLPFETLLNCKRLQTLSASAERISEALRDSGELELHPERVGVRRSGGRPPPPLQVKKQKPVDLPEPKVTVFKVEVPEENKVNWKEVRDAFRAKFSDLELVYTRFAGTEGHVALTGDLPEGTKERVTSAPLEISGSVVSLGLLEGEELLSFWKSNGSHYDMCGEATKKRRLAKTRGKTLKIGGKSFASVTKLRAYLRGLLHATVTGAEVDLQYHNLLEAVLKLHPCYEEKAKGLKRFEVGRHPVHEESKCFVIVRDDGSKEDFSVAKCLAQF